MEELLECKYCKGTKLEFHETHKVYNIDTNEEEDINNVYYCPECGAQHFDTEEGSCVQISKFVGQGEFVPRLANYMNS